MQILFYILLMLSALLGIAVGGLGLILGRMLQASYVNADQVWGWAVIFISLLYLSHPALVYWLFTINHLFIAIGLSVLFIVLSIVLVFFLPSAIGAGAMP